jgi:hypothetical protein
MENAGTLLMVLSVFATASRLWQRHPPADRRRLWLQAAWIGLVIIAAVAAMVGALVTLGAQGQRPVLQLQRGAAYQWSAPSGWRATEGQNVLELAAPDGLTGASLAYVLGAFGQGTPRGFLEMVLRTAPYQNLRFVSFQDLGTQPSVLPGMPWKVGYAELSYTYRGAPVRAGAMVGVIQGAGQYVATLVGWQAPAAAWDQARHWLPRVAQSIFITDASWAVTMARSTLPRNIPHDYIYGSYNQAWSARGIPEARLSQARREGMMGYEAMQSPSTGERYDMPLEYYDPAAGGYRNPEQPREILVRPPELRR